MSPRHVRWVDAWTEALYGEHGFYRRPEGPAGHFRTASHAAADALAAAIARLADSAGCTGVLDIGAGRGELLAALARRGEGRLLHGVDVVARPPLLPDAVSWSTRPPPPPPGTLVVAWELLDVFPCTVLEVDGRGVAREVLVEPATGRERLGEPAAEEDLAWCDRWWPRDGLDEGDRIEVGRSRDTVWAGLVGAVAAAGRGLLLAVDYGHDRGHRPAAGSLSGFRAGRAVPPRADGSTDITAHVALDAVAAAGRAAGADATVTTRQDAALRALGVRHAELLDARGLGGFTWLLQGVRQPVPPL